MDTSTNTPLRVPAPPARPARQRTVDFKCWCGWPATHVVRVNEHEARLCWQHYAQVPTVNGARWKGWRI